MKDSTNSHGVMVNLPLLTYIPCSGMHFAELGKLSDGVVALRLHREGVRGALPAVGSTGDDRRLQQTCGAGGRMRLI